MGSADSSRQKGIRAVSIALGVTILFVIVQVVGGWIANSLALLADAAHMATDVASYSLSLFAFWIGKRPPTPRMSFGYYRSEILAALISTLGLWVICVFLIYEAIRRLIVTPSVDGGTVFIIALITLIFNIITMRVLHGSSKESLNVKAAYLHVLSDLIGNIGVLCSGGIIWLTGWDLADPILTILFTGLILFSTLRILSESVAILMEASPKKLDLDSLRRALEEIPEVEAVHDLHAWTVSSGRLAMSVHLISRNSDTTLSTAHEVIKERFKVFHQTIQIEHPDRFESEYCFTHRYEEQTP